MSAQVQTPESGAPQALVFTDAAAHKVGELIREESNPALKLRVFVSGGGCSGFQYGFTFDENIEEGDRTHKPPTVFCGSCYLLYGPNPTFVTPGAK